MSGRSLLNGKQLAAKYLDTFQVLLVFVVLFAALSIMLPSFCSAINITNLLKQNSVALVIGAGMTMVLIAGELDISVGSVIALSGCVAGLVAPYTGMAMAMIVALAIGTGFGFMNGVITTKGRIPSFIVTLGTQMMARSLAYVTTQGGVVASYPEGWNFIGQATIGLFPVLFIFVIAVFVIMFVVLKKTSFGQYVYAVGSNRAAAVLSGINADAIKIKAMTIMGLLAGFGGIMLSSRALAVQADTSTGLEFDVIAGVIIGGTSLNGGSGNVLQTIIGVFIIGMIRNALNLSHIDIYWKDFVTGAVIVCAVLLDSARRQIQNRMSV